MMITWSYTQPLAVHRATAELHVFMYDRRRFWHLFLSTCCLVFLNALCPTINGDHVSLLGLVLLKVLFSVTLTLLMEQELLGWLLFQWWETQLVSLTQGSGVPSVKPC